MQRGKTLSHSLLQQKSYSHSKASAKRAWLVKKSLAQGALLRFGLRKKYAFQNNENAGAGNRKKKLKTENKNKKPYVDYHKKRL